ncbi:MAG: hypothetical protein GOU99_01330 [Candidatus Altiarchaeota archaeon]|nr:hypothetical protein [Candidatus Altiarchaeota archaeon]
MYNPDPFDQELVEQTLEAIFGAPYHEINAFLMNYMEKRQDFDSETEWLMLQGSRVYKNPVNGNGTGSDIDFLLIGDKRTKKTADRVNVRGKKYLLDTMRIGSDNGRNVFARMISPMLCVSQPLSKSAHEFYESHLKPSVLKFYNNYFGEAYTQAMPGTIKTTVYDLAEIVQKIPRTDHPKLSEYEVCSLIPEYGSGDIVYTNPRALPFKRIICEAFYPLIPFQKFTCPEPSRMPKQAFGLALKISYKLLSKLGRNPPNVLKNAIMRFDGKS